MSEIGDAVVVYYEKRGLEWPNLREAIMFVITELAEACEIDLAKGDWVRNNPQDKPEFDAHDLAVELGDVAMMAIVGGKVIGYDVIDLLSDKLERKLVEHADSTR